MFSSLLFRRHAFLDTFLLKLICVFFHAFSSECIFCQDLFAKSYVFFLAVFSSEFIFGLICLKTHMCFDVCLKVQFVFPVAVFRLSCVCLCVSICLSLFGAIRWRCYIARCQPCSSMAPPTSRDGMWSQVTKGLVICCYMRNANCCYRMRSEIICVSNLQSLQCHYNKV